MLFLVYGDSAIVLKNINAVCALGKRCDLVLLSFQRREIVWSLSLRRAVICREEYIVLRE